MYLLGRHSSKQSQKSFSDKNPEKFSTGFGLRFNTSTNFQAYLLRTNTRITFAEIITDRKRGSTKIARNVCHKPISSVRLFGVVIQEV